MCLTQSQAGSWLYVPIHPYVGRSTASGTPRNSDRRFNGSVSSCSLGLPSFSSFHSDVVVQASEDEYDEYDDLHVQVLSVVIGNTRVTSDIDNRQRSGHSGSDMDQRTWPLACHLYAFTSQRRPYIMRLHILNVHCINTILR
jgi:hypothetical protein